MLKPETVKLVVSEWPELQLPSNYIGVWGRLGIFFQENVLVFKKKKCHLWTFKACCMYCRCLEELTICSIDITPRQSTLNKLNTVNSDTELKLKKLLDMEVLCLNFFSFFICYLDTPQPTLSHYRGDSLNIHLQLTQVWTRFFQFDYNSLIDF